MQNIVQSPRYAREPLPPACINFYKEFLTFLLAAEYNASYFQTLSVWVFSDTETECKDTKFFQTGKIFFSGGKMGVF